MDIVSTFDEGEIFFRDGPVDAKSLEWTEHASFKGVYMKHLVRGSATGGRFSSHIVRVKAGCEIGEHAHEGKWEMQESIGGEGKYIFGGKEIAFKPGVSVVVPEGVKHRIIAGGEDLYLLARFVPALL